MIRTPLQQVGENKLHHTCINITFSQGTMHTAKITHEQNILGAFLTCTKYFGGIFKVQAANTSLLPLGPRSRYIIQVSLH